MEHNIVTCKLEHNAHKCDLKTATKTHKINPKSSNAKELLHFFTNRRKSTKMKPLKKKEGEGLDGEHAGCLSS